MARFQCIEELLKRKIFLPIFFILVLLFLQVSTVSYASVTNFEKDSQKEGEFQPQWADFGLKTID
jgi:hypothetical protein